MSTLTTRVTALEGDVAEIKSGVTAILAALSVDQPARPAKARKAAKAQPKAESEFVTWLRETAPQRAARKASNRDMADWLRSKGLPTNGPVWEAAKKGERKVTVLRKLV